jgi:hypothetical protein
MMAYFILGYIVLGVLTVIINAYDPFSRSFDFTLCNGWVFFILQVPILWVVMIIGWPYFLVRDLHEKITDIPNVKQWRQTGSFTKKL